MKMTTSRYVKGVLFFTKRYKKWVPFPQKLHIKGKGLDPPGKKPTQNIANESCMTDVREMHFNRIA